MIKLEQEYHHLSLWYFVSFIFGIIFFFQSGFGFSVYSISSGLCGLIILVRLFYKKSLLWCFIASCILSAVVGIFVAHLRVSNIDAKPIHKVMISEGTVKLR